MCLFIPCIASTLFNAMRILSASSTGAMRGGWHARIIAMQDQVIGMALRRRGEFQAMRPRAHQDTGPESRPDMQPQVMQLPAMQLRERYISPALLPDKSGTAHAPALRARHAGHAPRRQRPQSQRRRLLLQLPHSVKHAGKR